MTLLESIKQILDRLAWIPWQVHAAIIVLFFLWHWFSVLILEGVYDFTGVFCVLVGNCADAVVGASLVLSWHCRI